jgi:hypothetical protein
MKPQTNPKFTYGFYTDAREECFKIFGSVFDLPITKDITTEFKALFSKDTTVLDVGAAKYKVLQKTFNIAEDKYFTLDIDVDGDFSYHTPSDIPAEQKFDIMYANQLFEHLTIDQSVELVTSLSGHLADGGYFMAAVPNIFHPVRYWGDPTHVTFWDYKGLYMLMKYAGLKTVKIARYGKKQPEGFIETFVSKIVARLYRVDWCDSMLIIGQK